MEWKIEYIKEAQRDLKRLDPYNRKIILKRLKKQPSVRYRHLMESVSLWETMQHQN